MGKLSPIVSEFDSTEDEQAYQIWFAAKVAASLDDARPPIDHEAVMSEIDAIIARAELDKSTT